MFPTVHGPAGRRCAAVLAAIGAAAPAAAATLEVSVLDERGRPIENVAIYATAPPGVGEHGATGAALAAEQRAAVEAIEPVADGDDAPTALWYSSGEDAPYVGAGTGAPQLVLETAGLTNVAADIDETWTTWSWEALAASDPDVIVLVDAPWHTADSKIERLRANPATSQLEAVQQQRFVVVPFPMAEAGVGTVDATELVVDEVRAMELG